MSLEETVVGLNRLGIRTSVMESGADGALLILPEYGRVLGVWPHWRAENVLWENPDFLRLLQIGAKDDEWPNPGGDRMWLGPEKEFFPRGAISPAIDPGRYAEIPEKGMFVMENRGEARAWASDMRMRFRVVRRIRSLADGEISEHWQTQWLRQAGYVEEAQLEASGEIPPGACLWNITQVRAGAEVLLPPASVALRGEKPVRVELAAERAPSRILCVEEREGGRGHLIVKEFEKPAEADAPGPLVECRFTPGQGFGEFSCVSSAAGPRERRRVTWKSTVYAFSGRVDELRAAAQRISG